MLTGRQYQQLTSALAHAFPTAESLSMLVRFAFEENLAALVDVSQPLPVVVLELIQQMEARGWLKRFVVAARESNPGNPELAAVAEQLGFA